MTAGRRKFVLDANIFIRAFRDPSANEALQQFHRAFGPFEYLSVVVAQELRAGASSPADRRALKRHVLGIFERVDRVVVPSPAAWHRSGDVLAEMARTEGLEVGRVSKAFANDVLLALSCRESGATLITDNGRDFARIARFVPCEFVKPWSMPLV